MNRQFLDKLSLLMVTDKQANLGKLIDWPKKFTGHMFSIKLEKKSNEMSFKTLPVKIQWSKTDREDWGTICRLGRDRVYKFTAQIFDLRLKQANSSSKSDIANFINKTDFDNKLKDVT